jgi:hypothetical protein
MNPAPESQSPLRIILPTELIVVEHPIFLLVGQPGICKSSLGFSADDPIVLNYDSESAHARAVNRGPSLPVLTVAQQRALEADLSILDPYRTVVLDTVGGAVNTMSSLIIEDTPKFGNSAGPTQQGWGALKRHFAKFLSDLRNRGKNVLMIAHSKEDKSDDRVYMRPDIAGGSRDEIMRLADFVGYVYMNGKQRTLDFNPTDQWFGKNPAQWPAWNVPAPEKARTFMTQLFQMGREALGKASEASAGVALQVDDWRADIQTYRTVDEFNRAVPRVKGLAEPVQAQVAKILLDCGKERGLIYNREQSSFAEPAPQPKQERLVGVL